MSRVEHIQDTLKDITIELAKQQQDDGEEDTEDGEDITLQNRNSNASITSVENDKANIEYMQSKKGKKLMTDENRERGSLNFNVVFRFVGLGGGRLGLLFSYAFSARKPAPMVLVIGGYQFGQVQEKAHQKMILDLDGQLQTSGDVKVVFYMFISAAFL